MKFTPLILLSVLLVPGGLSRAEAQEAVRGRLLEQGFAKMDADRDGQLSVAEFRTIRAGAKYFQEHPDHLEPACKRLDADSDGALTLEEYRKLAQPRPRKPAGDGPPPKPEAAPAKPPTDSETRAALDFIQSKPDAKTGWTAFCQALWASHEFLARS